MKEKIEGSKLEKNPKKIEVTFGAGDPNSEAVKSEVERRRSAIQAMYPDSIIEVTVTDQQITQTKLYTIEVKVDGSVKFEASLGFSGSIKTNQGVGISTAGAED